MSERSWDEAEAEHEEDVCRDPDFDPPYELIEPARLYSGLVLSSPHSGRTYPKRFLDSSRLDAASLRRSEDAFVDDLFRPAVDLGCPLLRALFPRAYLDLNREPYELDPRMFAGRLPSFVNTRSLRVAGGLGTIARVVGESQEIYSRRLTVSEGLARIEQLYRPYHAALQGLIDRAVARFGEALLLDCHSMPSNAGGNQRDSRTRADFVLGDRYGSTCRRDAVDCVDDVLRQFGYRVERNKPYAGGFITEHYGQPALRRHALQIEVNRALYMDERTLVPNAHFDELSRHLGAVVESLTEMLNIDADGPRLAAE